MTSVSVHQTTPARQTPAITPAQGRAIWEDVQATVTLGTSPMRHGTLALAGWWTGSFSAEQLAEFEKRTQKLIRAARKARKVVSA